MLAQKVQNTGTVIILHSSVSHRSNGAQRNSMRAWHIFYSFPHFTALARKQSNSQIQGEIGDGAMEKDSELNEGVWVNLGTQVYTNICNI